MRRAFSSALSRDGASALTSGRMYNWRVRAVYSALDKAGKADGPLCAEDLYSLGHLDQYHYGGTDACDEAAALLGLDSGSTVLDIGSGIGGTSRYLAATTFCHSHLLNLRYCHFAEQSAKSQPPRRHALSCLFWV